MKGNEQKLPKWPGRLLRAICPADLLEEIEGDLLQRYNRDLDKSTRPGAKRKLLWNVIRYFRPGILFRHSPSLNLNAVNMLSSYFKIALRVMFRNKTYSAINVAGLAFGITGALLLFLWIAREFSYDQFHDNSDRLYVAWNKQFSNGQWHCWNTTPAVLGPTLAADYAGIERTASFVNWSESYLFSVGDTHIMKDKATFTDQDFLRMLSFPLIEGDSNTALGDPNSIVLTQKFANQLFGNGDAFGETVLLSAYGMEFPFIVKGVLKDLPSNTDIQFDYLLPFRFLESLGERDGNWYNNSVTTFVQLSEGADLEAVNHKIAGVKKLHTKGGDQTDIFLYPFEKSHLYSRFENGVPAGGRIEIVRMLGVLGLCLVTIACINFINLSTARAQRRSKEVAVRKVTGAYRRSLVFQFLCESVLIATAAGVFALAVVYLALPAFSSLIRQPLTLNVGSLPFWFVFVGFILVVGMLAGGYPALYLSSFKPVGILKGAVVSTSGKNTLRSVLVVLQFGFAITMIVSTLVVRKQIAYVQNRESGYAKDNLVYHPLNGALLEKYQTYKTELLQSGIASSVTVTSTPITQRVSNTNMMRWEGKDPDLNVSIERISYDEGLIETAGFTLIAGRDMDLQKYPSDSTAVIINESAAKLMGFDDPIGQIIEDNNIEGKEPWHVVGVIKDFILTSPYQKVEPMVLFGAQNGWSFSTIHIKLNQEKPTAESMEALTKVYTQFNPDYPFEYHFVDEEYARKFEDLETTRTITTLFTSIAIFISCLGLLGLSTYMTESRIKEIGIRRVLGGSVVSITRLLGVSSLKPILIAILLFSPLAWLSMNWWLNSYAYRIELNGWIFLLAAAAIMGIAMLTIGVQTIRAAAANPVESLRNE